MQTTDQAYTDYLIAHDAVGWRKYVDVQMLYRWNLHRLQLEFTLEIGCGVGRNLAHLNGNGIGIDHNINSVQRAKLRGLTAFTVEEFRASSYGKDGSFDSILLAHVVEHMSSCQAIDLLQSHLNLLKAGGKVVLITPQEAGYASDVTHVEFYDFDDLENVALRCGLEIVSEYSFPFPRWAGRYFKYNEFVLVGALPK